MQEKVGHKCLFMPRFTRLNLVGNTIDYMILQNTAFDTLVNSSHSSHLLFDVMFFDDLMLTFMEVFATSK